jgi:PadR family transcriptional regulator PadR
VNDIQIRSLGYDRRRGRVEIEFTWTDDVRQFYQLRWPYTGNCSQQSRCTCSTRIDLRKPDFRLLTYIELQCIRELRMELAKDLVAASATPLVLAILAEGESYGYAIIKRVTELSGGHMQWTDGMLYPVLHRLERNGLVAAKWRASESGRKRKYYRITKEGRAQLALQRQQWQVVESTLRGLWMKACTT